MTSDLVLIHYCYGKELAKHCLVNEGSGKWKVMAATDKSEIVAEVQAWLADPSLAMRSPRSAGEVFLLCAPRKRR